VWALWNNILNFMRIFISHTSIGHGFFVLSFFSYLIASVQPFVPTFFSNCYLMGKVRSRVPWSLGIFLLFFLKDGVLLLEFFSHLCKEKSSTYYYISRYYIIWQLGGGLVSKQHSHGVIEYLACWGKLQLHTEEGRGTCLGQANVEKRWKRTKKRIKVSSSSFI
jgi:hypothetical protein